MCHIANENEAVSDFVYFKFIKCTVAGCGERFCCMSTDENMENAMSVLFAGEKNKYGVLGLPFYLLVFGRFI